MKRFTIAKLAFILGGLLSFAIANADVVYANIGAGSLLTMQGAGGETLSVAPVTSRGGGVFQPGNVVVPVNALGDMGLLTNSEADAQWFVSKFASLGMGLHPQVKYFYDNTMKRGYYGVAFTPAEMKILKTQLDGYNPALITALRGPTSYHTTNNYYNSTSNFEADVRTAVGAGH